MPRWCVAILILAGCTTPTHQEAWQTAPKPPVEPVAPEPSLSERADEAWERRHDAAALRQAIDAWEQLAAQEPTNGYHAKLARAYFLLGNAFLLPAGASAESLQAFDKGMAAGERAMMSASEDFAARVRADGEVEAALSAIGSQGLPAMYWYAANLGRFAASNMTTAAIYHGRLDAVMSRVMELDPTFFFGAPHRYFGAFHAEAPPFLGGDVDKSKSHFEQALQIEPNCLETKVLFAEHYALKAGDKDLFVRLLEEVVAADPSALPQLLPEQQLAQQRAARLLEGLNDLF